MTDLLARWPADPPEPPGVGRSAPVDGVAEAPAAVRGIGGVLKSVTDLTAALVLLVLVAPVLLGIALAVRCDGGPAFYRQIRVGRDGVPLRMLKFRSMRVDADRLRAGLRVDDEGAGPLFKLRADPRVARGWRSRHALFAISADAFCCSSRAMTRWEPGLVSCTANPSRVCGSRLDSIRLQALSSSRKHPRADAYRCPRTGIIVRHATMDRWPDRWLLIPAAGCAAPGRPGGGCRTRRGGHRSTRRACR